MLVALITEVFFDGAGARDGASDRPEIEDPLTRALSEAKDGGAQIAVLPELPLNAWAPCSKQARDGDAEAPDGSRQTRMSRAAAAAGLALVGGAIVRDPDTGTRHNTALVYGADGSLVTRYRKVHLPEEEGYWETSHYEPGDEPPRTFPAFALAGRSLEGWPEARPVLGLQICSDVNRPEGFQLLAAQGADVVFAPRATPPETYDRWRLILRANAIMSGAYVVSVNRPRPEGGASIGGPSVVIDPTGAVVAETTDRVRLVPLEARVVDEARREYPGYLERFPDVYARGWRALSS